MPWEISADDELARCACDAGGSMTFTSVPSPIRDFLQHLERCGKVRVELIGHHVTKVEGNAEEKFTIKAKEQSVFKPTPDTSRRERKVDIKNLSGLIALTVLEQSEHVRVANKLTYRAEQNRILAGNPGIFLKNAVRVKKGDVLRFA